MDTYEISLGAAEVLVYGGVFIALAVIWFAYMSRPVKSRLTEEEKQILDDAFNFDGDPDE